MRGGQTCGWPVEAVKPDPINAHAPLPPSWRRVSRPRRFWSGEARRGLGDVSVVRALLLGMWCGARRVERVGRYCRRGLRGRRCADLRPGERVGGLLNWRWRKKLVNNHC